MNDDKLNQFLKKAVRSETQPQFDSIDQFKARFFNAVQKTEHECKPAKALWWFIGGGTAAALLIISFFLFFLNMPQVKNNRNNLGICSSSDIHNLNEELNILFPEEYINLWLVNGNLETVSASEPGKRNILINYVIECLDNGRKQFIQMSLMSANNNKSELHLKRVNGSVWVYSPDDKMVAVDTDLVLQLEDGSNLNIQQSKLLGFNAQAVLDTFIHNGKKYQLTQVVRRI